jgi:hypothetical protein
LTIDGRRHNPCTNPTVQDGPVYFLGDNLVMVADGYDQSEFLQRLDDRAAVARKEGRMPNFRMLDYFLVHCRLEPDSPTGDR